MVYGRDPEGRFGLRADADGDGWDPEWPVVMIDWEGARAYAAWLAGPGLEAVREHFDFAARTREATGIDGVSLGGMLALETGLRHPDAFGTVGAIQPAISERFEALALLASPGRQQIRLLSSDDDPFLAPTLALSDGLTARAIEHDRLVVPGPHGYAFNRGPGAIELLFFHDRALAREPL